MDEATAEALLISLLERLEADALSQRSNFGGLISLSERTALRIMIEKWSEKHNHVPVNKTVLNYKESPNPKWILCLDFGTAKSKAFAATDSEAPEFHPLSLGKKSKDPDGSVYAVSSSVGSTTKAVSLPVLTLLNKVSAQVPPRSAGGSIL